jgi:hypothetical protein
MPHIKATRIEKDVATYSLYVTDRQLDDLISSRLTKEQKLDLLETIHEANDYSEPHSALPEDVDDWTHFKDEEHYEYPL